MTYHRPIIPEYVWYDIDRAARKLCETLVSVEKEADFAGGMLHKPTAFMDIAFLSEDLRCPVGIKADNPGFVGRRWDCLDAPNSPSGYAAIGTCSAVNVAHDHVMHVVGDLNVGQERVFDLCTFTEVAPPWECLLNHAPYGVSASVVEEYFSTEALAVELAKVSARCHDLREKLAGLFSTLDYDRRTLECVAGYVSHITRDYAELWGLAAIVYHQIHRQYVASRKLQKLYKQYLKEESRAK